MTAPRQPRQWGKNAEEPPTGVDRLKDSDGDILGRHRDGWLWITIRGRSIVDSEATPWSELDDVFDVAWPVEEVLPETPEPPKASVSETVSRIATLMAQDSEERTADQTAELMQLKATLDEVIAIRDDVNEIVQDQTKRWGMCEMNKLAELLHLRGYRKAVPASQSSPAPLLPLSVPVETEGQVEAVRGQLADHLVPIALAAGWTPPLPADGVALIWGWQASGGEYFPLDGEDQARRFVAACEGSARLACARWVAVPVEPKETK